MAACEVDGCSRLSDEDTTANKCLPPNSNGSTPSAPPTLTVPSLTNPNPRQRPPQCVPPSHPPPSEPSHIPNCANPPTGLFHFIYKGLKRQFSPLQSLIMNGDAELLVDLVRQKSSSVMEPNSEGWMSLHEAAYYGQLQCVRVLVNAHPDSVNRGTLKNQTALLLAASRGNISCVAFLLEHGANPNIANTDRETPLYTACEHPNEAIVTLLLKFGAKVNSSCIQGTSALHEACRHGKPQLCSVLLEAGANLQTRNVYGISPFFTAAQHGQVDVLHLLAERGADINGQAVDGASPLFEACKNGHVSAVDVLLSLKADANRSTKSGLLPLHVAVQNNHLRIVSMLIPETSRVGVRHSGISPLHIAAEKDRDDIMELLIESGFDVNAKLSEGRSRMYEDRRCTAVYFSVYNGNLEAAKMLLQAGANPNLDVFSPLLVAVRLGWVDMSTLLLQYGADVNAQVSAQPAFFPPSILLSMESVSLLKLMLDNGCDARSCFRCPYGQRQHPAVTASRRPVEEMQSSGGAPMQHNIQFCEAVSSPALRHMNGSIISLLLDYVSHVQLCSRLLQLLESRSDWMLIKLKAYPPHPLMQLCRLKIRCLVGVQRLKLLHTLPLPVRLICFLQYHVSPELTCPR